MKYTAGKFSEKTPGQQKTLATDAVDAGKTFKPKKSFQFFLSSVVAGLFLCATTASAIISFVNIQDNDLGYSADFHESYYIIRNSGGFDRTPIPSSFWNGYLQIQVSPGPFTYTVDSSLNAQHADFASGMGLPMSLRAWNYSDYGGGGLGYYLSGPFSPNQYGGYDVASANGGFNYHGPYGGPGTVDVWGHISFSRTGTNIPAFQVPDATNTGLLLLATFGLLAFSARISRAQS